MAGKIQFNIHPLYTNNIKSDFSATTGNGSTDTIGEGVPGILIDIDSIVSIGSEVKELDIVDLEDGPIEPVAKQVRVNTNDVILFLKDVPYNNIPGSTKVQNPYKFRLSVRDVITNWNEQWLSGQLKLPNGVDFPCKDAGDFGMINCINSKFDLLQATIEAIEANPGSGVTPVKVGVDIDTFRDLFPAPVTPTPFSFNLFPAVDGSPEAGGSLGVGSTPCLDELSALLEKGIIEGPGHFLDASHDAIESQNEEAACELLETLKGAS